MGKLFFYSDQKVESPGNQRLDKILIVEGKKNIKIGYIPSTEDKGMKYYNTKV
jgi:dipeptidase E